jgi:hypothetical protein
MTYRFLASCLVASAMATVSPTFRLRGSFGGPAVAVAEAVRSGGQAAQSAQPHFAFPPPAAGITVTNDVEYAGAGGTALKMDVYHPPNSQGRRLPALIFFNRAVGEARREPFWVAWARTAASKGLVAIMPDIRDGSEAADFKLLVPYLVEHGADVGVDREMIAVYAASGNVFAAFPAVEDPSLTALKAAVMYYGAAPITEFRRDLPVLYVRAGLDRPSVNRSIGTLAALAVTENAPVTVLNHPTGHHGFEIADDDDATRDVIERTLDFVLRATSPPYQAALGKGLPEASAAAAVQAGNFKHAASIYSEMLGRTPDDARLRLSYGEALLGDGQFAAACGEFERLKGKGLGYRDLGIPAARACMQKGDGDAAIAWLASIPVRFRPMEMEKDPIFAPVQNRPEFKALFTR